MTYKRLLLLLIIPLLMGATPTRQYPNTVGTVIDATKVTANEDVIYLYLQAGVEAYKDGSIIGNDLVSSIAITSSGNMTFSGTTNISTLQLGGVAVTSSAAELNKTDGLNATTAELNILNGATLSTIELNYVDDVTSAIQTQLNAKSPLAGSSSIITLGTITTGIWNGTAIPTTNGGTGSTSTTYCNLASNVTGTLPVGNGGTGATAAANAANGVVVLNASTQLPAVSGALLTNLPAQTPGAGTITSTMLKTTLGEISVVGNENGTLPGGEYGFYPQIKSPDGTAFIAYMGWNNTGTTYTSKIGFQSSSTTWAQQRYVTASGEDMWIFMMVDRTTKEVLGMYQAPDHPAYGNGGDFEKFPHPFMYNDLSNRDIILIEKTQAKEMEQEAKSSRLSILGLIDRDYKIDFTKTYPYEPIHSGQFSPDDKPVLVKNIPDYISVRKLRKL